MEEDEEKEANGEEKEGDAEEKEEDTKEEKGEGEEDEGKDLMNLQGTPIVNNNTVVHQVRVIQGSVEVIWQGC